VNPTEHNTKTSFAETDVFALLGGLLRIKGTRAPSHRSAAPRHLTLAVLVAAFAVVLLAPASAFGLFTRPFLRQIAGTCETPGESPIEPGACPHSKLLLFGSVGGVAGDEKDDLWVGDLSSGDLDEFSPAYLAGEPNRFLETLPTKAKVPPNDVTIERSNGDFYVTNPLTGPEQVEVFSGAGAHLKTWAQNFEDPHIAIDDATESVQDPSACGTGSLAPFECFVYVAQGRHGLDEAVEKFNAEGEPEDFVNAKGEPMKLPYLEGAKNTKGEPIPEEGYRITGFPAIPGCEGERFKAEGPGAVTVDSKGDIYVATNASGCGHDVLEYAPSGKFVQAFSPENGGVPLLEGDVGTPDSVVFDPVSGHLLVGVVGTPKGAGVEVAAVDEFDAVSGKFLNQITESSPGAPLRSKAGSMEMTVDSHGDLYVVDSQRDAVDVFGPGVYLPGLRLGEAAERMPTGAVLTGSVNPESLSTPDPAQAGIRECYFEYVPQAQYEASRFGSVTPEQKPACVPAAGALEHDSTFQPVHAAIAGLVSGTTYRYRLVAVSEGALGGEGASVAQAFTAPHKPSVEAQSASASSAFVSLSARIAPLGAGTSYYFEYGPTAAYGQDAPALTPAAPEGASIGLGGPAGDSVESVSQNVGALTAGSEYHFRVVAENAFGTEYGADQTFTTLPAPGVGLPDGRAYELVTPAEKEGGSDMFALPQANGQFENIDVGTPSEAGNGFLLHTYDAFGPFPASFANSYVFRRDPAAGDWSYTSLAAPSLGAQSIAPSTVFDPVDLSRVGINDGVGSLSGAEGERLTQLVGPPGGGAEGNLYTKLYAGPVRHEGGGKVTVIAGASRDLSHVVLESDEQESGAVCPGAEKVKAGSVLCEWAPGHEAGALTLVNARTSEKGAPPVPLSTCGAVLGRAQPVAEGRPEGSTYGAVSADGSRVFFTAPDPRAENGGAGCWNGSTEHAPQLYMRLNGTTTVDVSEPEAGVTEAGSKEPGQRPVAYPVVFAGASADGAEVFFLTETWETANHPAGHDMELYGYDTESGELARVSAGETGSPALTAGAAVHMVLAVPTEAAVVYFTADGVLAANQNADGAHAEPGTCTTPRGIYGDCALYRYQAATGTTPAKTTFVATSEACSFEVLNEHCSNDASEGDPIAFDPAATRAYSTPDGRYLLFKNDSDIFRYRYEPESPSGGSLISIASGEFDRSYSKGPASGPLRAMSNNGEYVFFDSPSRLVPSAENHTLDVYEWHEGHGISLISSPNASGPSYFLGYSPYQYEDPAGKVECLEDPGRRCEQVEGGNVFIGTHASLVPQDTASTGQIYDARICEPLSPCIKPPAGETAQCEGGSCQHPPPASPDPTATLLAPPAPVSPAPLTTKVTTKTVKCKSGYVRKKVKKKTECVKKPKKKSKAKKSDHGRTGR
jgi:hypothetical protein